MTERLLLQEREQFALKLSIVGTLFMAVLGFGFAYLTNSDAVMLDGVFSLVGFTMSLLTLYVSRLVIRPGDDRFHFGYAHFEPLLNVFKSLIIITICAVALVTAIDVILAGGRLLMLGPALVYAAIASVGCLAIAFYMRNIAILTQSPLVAVDAKGWMIDGILSLTLCLSFLVIYLLQDSAIAKYLVYADSGLVAVLVILSLPIPYKILKENLREVLIMAPAGDTAEEIEKHLTEAARAFQFDNQVVRIQKYGRETYLNVHMVLDKDYAIDTIDTLDNIRAKLDAKMKAYDPHIVMDLIFVGDEKWAG